mmetsp:Transcript_16040/g.32288  ORF Transcript_16040/g.32288 Transcript_16040/m.32288 type:complete len:239 (-) Transcript_16040:182-898(-)
MIEPAPKVNAARASAAKPQDAPAAAFVEISERVQAERPPGVECVVAEPPADGGSFIRSRDGVIGCDRNNNDGKNNKSSLEALRSAHGGKLPFEAPAGIIVGPADKNSFQKLVKPFRIFNERAFVSYGEIRRYIAMVDTNLFVYAEKSDPTPLYTIPFSDLIASKEDPNRPDFYSHTVSPEANVGLPFSNKTKGCLDTVLLRDSSMKIVYQIVFDRLETEEGIADIFVSAVGSKRERKR